MYELYAENDQTNVTTAMLVTVNGAVHSSSIAGHGYAAGDVVGFYIQTGAGQPDLVVNSKLPPSLPAGYTVSDHLFSLPLIGSVTLLPIIPQGGSTQFTVVNDRVEYKNPPLIEANSFLASPPNPPLTLPIDLKPWVPSAAREAHWNMDSEIHSSAAGVVIGGCVLTTPRGNIKNISLYPSGPAKWDAQDVKIETSLKHNAQVFNTTFSASAGQIDNLYCIAFVEGFIF